MSNIIILPKPTPVGFGNTRNPDLAKNVENSYKNQAQVFLIYLTSSVFD